MNASTFPDDIRPPSKFSKEFHRSTHHYVTFRFTPQDPNRSIVEPPADEENLLTTYKAYVATVKSRNPDVSAEDKAIAEDAKKGIVRARKAVQANINAAPGTAAGEGGPQ